MTSGTLDAPGNVGRLLGAGIVHLGEQTLHDALVLAPVDLLHVVVRDDRFRQARPIVRVGQDGGT